MIQPVPIRTSFLVDAVTSTLDGTENVELKHLSSCLSDATINASRIRLVIDEQDAKGLFELGDEFLVTFQRVGHA